MTIEQELITIKKRLDELKVQKIESATRLKGLEADKLKLLAECKEIGVDPKAIDKAIDAKTLEIKMLIEKVKGSLEQFDVITVKR